MKLIVLLLTVTCLQLHANSFAQQVTLKEKDVPLEKVFKQIYRQTGYQFVYTYNLLQHANRVSIDAVNTPLEEVLAACFKDQPFTYILMDRAIIVTKKKAPDESGAAKVPAPVQITGHVTDSAGNPLVGVTIKVKEGNSGTVTDAQGNYSIMIPDNHATLVVSYIGYKTIEIPVNGRSSINIVLQSAVSSLNQLIVVGYGTQLKKDLTGSIGSVDSKTLSQRSSTSIGQELAGQIPGVNVAVNSGRPGGMPMIRIRGNTSISITNDPLYLVDGIPTPSIDFLDPNNIESIVVLKDAASTAIYGARGSNGVVLITTKHGGRNGGVVTYSSTISLSELPREMHVLNAKEFLHVEDVAYQNAQKYDSVGWAAGQYTDPKLKRTNPLLFDAKGNPLYNTDWQKETMQKAFSQDHHLSFTWGNDQNDLGIYLGYRNDNGIVRSSFLKRYDARFTFNSQIKPWLKVGGSLSYTNQNENQVDRFSSSIEVLRETIEQLPIIPVKYPDGTWASNADYPGSEQAPNPIQILEQSSDLVKTQVTMGNTYVNISLAKGLELRSTLGVYINNLGTNYYAGKDLNYISRAQGGIATVASSRSNTWQSETYLQYKKEISDVQSITALLGASWQHSDYYNVSATSWDFEDDFFQTNNLGIGSNPQPPSSGANAYDLNSYYARINYSLKDRYLLSASLRTDGSSRFGPSKRYALFPSVGLGWRVSEEKFLKEVSAISNLKLRASFGFTGNSEIGLYQAEEGLGAYTAIFNDERVTGIGVGRLPNPDLRWEKTRQINLGMDLGLLENRISLEVDLYNKLTTNMLLNTPVPTTSGFSTVAQNIGSMRNRGIEVGLNTVNIKSGNFSWSTTFNIAINKNQVVSLTRSNADINLPPSYVAPIVIARVGEDVTSFYGYTRLGTWGTDEAAEAARYGKLPGDLKYEDVNNDGIINSLDEKIIGKGSPTGYGSFVNTFHYKNFDLLFDLQYMYGNDVFVASLGTQEDRQGIANSRATVLDAWTPDHQNTPIAQLRPIAAGYDLLQDTRMVKNGSFIRGRNLLLSYTFSPDLIKDIHLSSLRLTASVQNLFLITKYDGYDPEVTSHPSTFGQGIINFDYPKPRVFMFGLDVSF